MAISQDFSHTLVTDNKRRHSNLPSSREVEVGIAVSHGSDCGQWYVCEVSIPVDTPAAAVEAAARQATIHLLEVAESDDIVTGIWLYHDPGLAIEVEA